MKQYLKILVLFLYALATIITCAAVWNSRPDAFIAIVSIALFFANAYIIYEKAKNIKDKDKE